MPRIVLASSSPRRRQLLAEHGYVFTVAAADVQVLAVPVPVAGDSATAAVDGALVVLATTPREATVLAGASTTDRLSVTLLAG